MEHSDILSSEGPAEVVGVDACPKGWVAVHLSGGRFASARVARTLASVLDSTSAPVVAVDIPLGLTARGPRACDVQAAALVGARARSVFRMPPRPVVETRGYDEAGALCRQLTGRGLTQQTYALFPKVREANALRSTGEGRLYEVHPEVSFRAMAGAPLVWSKHTWNGQATRRRLLGEAGIVLPDVLGQAGELPPDDVLDAAAAAWSAHRIVRGQALRCPDPPEKDDAGDVIAIWY